MRLNKQNLDSQGRNLYENGGLAHLEVNAAGFVDNDFSDFLNSMHTQLAEMPGNFTHLQFENELSDLQCDQLAAYIQKHPEKLAFSELTFKLTQNSIKSERFKNLLKTLNASKIQKCHFNCQEIETNALLALAENIYYPITLNLVSPEFTDIIIANMHAKADGKVITNEFGDAVNIERKALVKNDEINRLKQVFILKLNISNDEKKKILNASISHQHQEQQQQQQQQIVQQQVQQQTQQQQQQQQEGVYTDTLVDFKSFSAADGAYFALVENKKDYELVKNELFANIPHGIKYLSPAAATVIAKHLSLFATLNSTNLPENFKLTKTEAGELVLDYNAKIANENISNPFTPSAVNLYHSRKPIYDINHHPKEMTNLWIRFGESGVQKFNNDIRKFNELRPNWAPIIKNYIAHFPQRDHLYADDYLKNCLTRIQNYDNAQSDCLMKFLENTHRSGHDLNVTLNAFDSFWLEWKQLCKSKNIDPNIINNNWSTPEGGDPRVYMDRLLTILKNARSIEEQCQCLNGIKLDNYGAYYASKHEDFKVVAKSMGLEFDSEKHNHEAFNANKKIYHVQLDEIQSLLPEDYGVIDYGYRNEEYLNKNYSTNTQKLNHIRNLIHRFAGEQEKGISIPMLEGAAEGRAVVEPVLFTLLLLTAHDRNPTKYDADVPSILREKSHRVNGLSNLSSSEKNPSQSDLLFLLRELLKDFESNKFRRAYTAQDLPSGIEKQFLKVTGEKGDERFEQVGFLKAITEGLLGLYKSGIYINYSEMMMVLSGLDEAGHFQERLPGLSLPLEDFFKKLFDELGKNKHDVIKVLNLIKERKLKRNIFQTIETSEYLSKEPIIRTAYQDCLFKFSALISPTKNEDELAKIRNALKAAGEKTNPNLDIALRIILASDQPFGSKSFLDAFKEIESIPEANPSKAMSVLLKYNFRIIVGNQNIFSNAGTSIKAPMIDFLWTLEEHTKKKGAQEKAREACKVFANSLESNNKQNYSDEDLRTIKASLIASAEGDDILQYYFRELKNENLSSFIQDNLKQNFKSQYKPKTFYIADQPESNYSKDGTKEERSARRETFNKKFEQWAEKKKKTLEEKEKIKQQDDALTNPITAKSASELFREKMSALNIEQLQERIESTENKNLYSELKEVAPYKQFFQETLVKIRDCHIIKAFSILDDGYFKGGFKEQLAKKLNQLENFSNPDSFEKIKNLRTDADALANMFSTIISNTNFKSNAEAFKAAFLKIDYKLFDQNTLWNLLNLLNEMPQRNYSNLLSAVVSEKTTEEKNTLIKLIRNCNQDKLPTYFIERIVSLDPAQLREMFRTLITPIFKQDNKDPLLKWLFSAANNSPYRLQIAELTQAILQNRDHIANLFSYLGRDNKNIGDFCNALNSINDVERKERILQTIALCENYSTSKESKAKNYGELVTKLNKLTDNELTELESFIEKSHINTACLSGGLDKRRQFNSMNEFLQNIEKEPFGKRPDDQFDIEPDTIDRVINGLVRMDTDQLYTYTMRKQILEAFLFINRAGNDLKLYDKLPAKDLSNAQIAELFQQLKTNSPELAHLDDFQRHLFALGLMREAMYRATGKLPNSTQMIALINFMMQPGDVIANIDTGQGKSLTDTMMAALLWLKSDRVDLVTSSIADAKNSIDEFSPFLSILGIPHSKTPVISTTPVREGDPTKQFQESGINFSTMSQLALLHAKAKHDGKTIDKPTTKASLFLAEADSILNDTTVIRYAIADPELMGNDWVYSVINDFVTTNSYIESRDSNNEDLIKLRAHLSKEAKSDPEKRFVEGLSTKQLQAWLNSAILVNFNLKQDIDYVLTKQPELKRINGVDVMTRSANIIMNDGRVSLDLQYGDGMQQLLYAKLNKELDNDKKIFHTDCEGVVLASTNNRNMINHYRRLQGYVKGSTGTVGNPDKLQKLFRNFGFSFFKMEPHQAKQLTKSTPIISTDLMYFETIMKQIKQDQKNDQPTLVFLKDIKTAEAFYRYLQNNNFGEYSQIYTGQGDESETVKNAGLSKMITVTTSLGRNTDIKDQSINGLSVIHGFLDTTENMRQRGGRTGRQGKLGHEHVILNANDLSGKYPPDMAPQDIVDKEIQLLDVLANSIIELNEPLFLITDYFDRKLEGFDPKFINNDWAKLRKDLEKDYFEQNQAKTYDKNIFITHAVGLFNSAIKAFDTTSALQADQNELLELLEFSHVKSETTDPYEQRVLVNDCTRAEDLAYHFLNKSDNASLVETDAIKTNLKSVFEHIKNGTAENLSEQNRTYINYLLTSTNCSTARAAHQAFLKEFLTEHNQTSQNKGFFKRWKESERHLDKIAGNENYLMTFKALTAITGSENIPDDYRDAIKNSAIALLKEYRTHCWFISPSKKRAADELIEKITAANDVTSVIVVLSESKMELLNRDIKTSDSFYRRHIRTLNAGGRSRYQETLDKALDLASALTGLPTEDLTPKLAKSLTQITDSTKQSAELVPEKFESSDHYQQKKEKGVYFYRKGQANSGAIIDKSLEASLKRNSDKNEAMKTRTSLFPKNGK